MILLNREQLYREVWSIPFTKLAPKYNIDATKLRKLSEKLYIPIPKMGYWQKLSFGKTIAIPELPIYPCYRLRPQKAIQKIDKKIAIIKSKYTVPVIEVKKNLTRPHPFVISTQNKLQKMRTDKYGVKRPGTGYLNLRVSPANEKRALKIWNTLLHWFEKNNLKIELSARSQETYVHLNGQRISIAIEEKTSVSKKTPEKWGNHTFYHTEYAPTNKLSLLIKEYCWDNIQKVWSDGKRTQLEELLGEFIDGLYIFADYEKARDEKRQREHEEYERKERERKYLLECAEHEREMEKSLETQVQDWHFSEQLRKYILTVQEKANQMYQNQSYPEDLIAWIQWASSIADKRDPLRKSLPSYTKVSEAIDLSSSKLKQETAKG